MGRKEILILVIGILIGFLIHSLIPSSKPVESPTVAVSTPPPTPPPTPTPEPAIDPKEMLAAPKFSVRMPVIPETKLTRDIEVMWEPVKGAMGYRVSVFDPKGVKVKEYTAGTKDKFIALSNIPYTAEDEKFAFFTIRLSSLNGAKKYGPDGDAKKLKVWREHAMMKNKPRDDKELFAPNIKSITIED